MTGTRPPFQGDSLGDVLPGLKPMGYSVFALRAMQNVQTPDVHRRVPDRRRRARWSTSTIRGGTPDMTSGVADADHAGAREVATSRRDPGPGGGGAGGLAPLRVLMSQIRIFAITLPLPADVTEHLRMAVPSDMKNE
jgi:hypothetical protein